MAEDVLMVGQEELELFAHALHSPVRRRILALLAERELNVNEIASVVGVSQSSAVTHVQALERARLITTRTVSARKGVQKYCTTRVASAVVMLRSPSRHEPDNRIVTEMPVGLFFDHEVHPTCGMASETGLIGFVDSPGAFVDPRRAAAQLIWFERGYVEYRLPVRAHRTGSVRSVAVSAELCSEFPGNAEQWPSDITVWMNGVEVGTFRSPGDPGDRRGHLNPAWWDAGQTQYGFLKEWRVTDEGSYVDGVRVSDVVIADLSLPEASTIRVRFGIREDAEFRGGMNLFGRRFGNYPQDIRLTIVLDKSTISPRE